MPLGGLLDRSPVEVLSVLGHVERFKIQGFVNMAVQIHTVISRAIDYTAISNEIADTSQGWYRQNAGITSTVKRDVDGP